MPRTGSIRSQKSSGRSPLGPAAANTTQLQQQQHSQPNSPQALSRKRSFQPASPRRRTGSSGTLTAPSVLSAAAAQSSLSAGTKLRRRAGASYRAALASSPPASFATFLIVGPTCFFLGILFSLLPYDYSVLWAGKRLPAGSPPPAAAFDVLEGHLRFLHGSPPLIARMLNIVIGVALLGFSIKLLNKPKETNVLFDGASLILYVATLAVYLSNFIHGLRTVSAQAYADPAAPPAEPGQDLLGREDSLRVIAASNTIMALLLVGILVLQAGQWYAARSEQAELEKIRRGSDAATAAAADGADAKPAGFLLHQHRRNMSQSGKRPAVESARADDVFASHNEQNVGECVVSMSESEH